MSPRIFLNALIWRVFSSSKKRWNIIVSRWWININYNIILTIVNKEIMQSAENMPNFCQFEYFWMLWFDEFFFFKKALIYYRFKMMDRYQLEQKSSRDMWQLGLDIYKNWLRLTKLCHDAWPIYLVLLWFTLWIIEFVSPT